MRLKALKTICSESSIHGIPYLSNDEIHLIEKLFWTILTVFSFICCFLLIGNILTIFRDDPTMIYSSDVAVPVTKIPFPSVTLCYDLISYGNLTYSLYHDIKQQLQDGEITVEDLSDEILKDIQAISLIISDDFLLSYNISRIPTDDIVDRLVEFTLSIRKTYMKSSFSDFYATNFAEMIGPSGICYNFNLVDANLLYKNLENSPQVFTYQHDLEFSATIDKYVRDSVDMINFTNPLSLMEATSGFNIEVLDRIKGGKWKVDEFVKTYDFFKFTSPRIYINNPYEIYSRSDAFYNNPESRMFYFIEPKQLIIDSTLKDYGSDVRGCYYVADGVTHDEDERTLKYFNIYTKGNCKHECLINRTLEVCGCVQFFMIHYNTTQICGIHDMACYKQVEEEVDNSDVCKCYPACGEIVYNVIRSIPDFIKTIPAADQLETFLERSRPRNHFIFISVKFNSPTFLPSILKRQFTEIDLVAYTGGAFGLFLGISITSFVEVFYYFTFRLMFGWVVRNGYGNKVTANEVEVVGDSSKSRFSYLVYYFSISTVHGMNQIVMDKRHYVERIFWILILGFSLLYCGISSFDMYEKLQKASIVITYDSDESSVESIPFPAIFFTPEIILVQNLVEREFEISRYNSDPLVAFRYLKRLNLLNVYLTNSFMCNFRRALKKLSKLTKSTLFDDYTIVDDMYKFSKYRWFVNQSVTWNEKFRPEMIEILSRSGFGFSFNRLRHERLFRDGISPNFTKVRDIIKFDANENSKHLDLILVSSYPLKAKRNTELKFMFTKIRTTLFKHICQFPYFNVHSPFEIPKNIDDKNSVNFFYGQDLEVLITPNVIKSDQSLQKFPLEKRNCYYEGEKTLKMFKIYTKFNCEIECLADYYLQVNETQCVPYYVLRNESNSICPPEKYNLAIKKSFNFYQKDPRKPDSKAAIESCKCLDTCNDVQYNIEIIEKKLDEEIKDRNLANMTITFKYKNDKFLPLVRRISFTFDEFLCQAGGLLGLFAGISALSVVEVLYFVFIRPVFNFYRLILRRISRRD